MNVKLRYLQLSDKEYIRIMLTVSEKNSGAIKAYTNAKFKTEGIMKQAFYREGKFNQHKKMLMMFLIKMVTHQRFMFRQWKIILEYH